MAQLQLKNIHKVYDNGFHAVHDFSISVEKGEFVVFVGPSGCGKSTSLRMIAGLEEITEGELYIGGKLANDKSPRDRGIAMVFQSYALYPHMTVYENMAFGLSLKGLNEDIIESRVKRIAGLLGLEAYLDRFPRELSGGQRQRVAVGRAIIRRVEVFLMDEPLSNLDAKQRVSMRAEIINIHRSIGATTIYVTHDQTEAMTMADRIVVMKDGYVQQIGTPYQLYFNPANQFVAGFIGEPPMNFLPCVFRDGKLHAQSDNETSYALSAERPELLNAARDIPVVMGFRPEGIQLLREGENAPQGGFVFTASVELTEMLGDNANLYLDLSGNELIAKVLPRDIPPVDSLRAFHVTKENLYFFNGDTGMALGAEETRA